MENMSITIGITSGLITTNTDKQITQPWRPWVAKGHAARSTRAYSPYSRTDVNHPEDKSNKHLQVVHPVKLYWPKSRCFDYLYQDAETLLRRYPVQATICLYEDASSDEDDSDEEDDKELN